MRNTNSTFRLLVGVIAMATAFSACTKKKELRNDVDSSAYIAKTDLVGKTFHLTRGVEDADDTNRANMVPGFSEDFGLVEARVTEDQLQFVSVYNPNGRTETATIVASYPIKDQFDIKRDTNDFGDQTNKIVEDRKAPWSKRQFIRVDWSNPTNVMSKMFSPRATEENTTLLETAQADKTGHISWKVETAVTNGWTAGTRVIYRTHLLPAKSSDFQPVEYSMKDFERFGYFTTETEFKNRQHSILDKDVTRRANVFNICEPAVGASCSTNKVVWVLSKGFPEKYKAVTRQAVREWNETVQAALGRKDDVVILDESVEAEISDPTRNVIAYYEPRVSFRGLLGVAQEVTDPKTGMTIAARTTIFEDGIQGVIGGVDQIIDILDSKDPIAEIIKTDALKGTATHFKSPFTGAKIADHVALLRSVLGTNKIKSQSAVSNNIAVNVRESAKSFSEASAKSTIRTAKLAAKVPGLFAFQDASRVVEALPRKEEQPEAPLMLKALNAPAPALGGLERVLFAPEVIQAQHDDAFEQAEHGIHSAELVEDAAVRYLLKLAKKQTPQQMKAAREQIKEEVAKLTFYTTLLHEMGHNFGLRHNFAGSADVDNYMPQWKQLKAKLEAGDKTVHADDLLPFQFSSIMDYGGDFYSQTGGLGDYDKAAIKYAYNRGASRDEIALKKDPKTGKLTSALKFKFCSDELADQEITCRRWDKGRNVTEVTLESINAYNREWPLSHFRRDRVYFGNPNAMLWRNVDQMIPIRQVMDEFIYSFVAAEKIDDVTKAEAKAQAAKNQQPDPTEGLCENKFIFESVVRGEIANICNPLSMEEAGVDPTDLETLPNALFDQTGQLRQNPATKKPFVPGEYVPYGMADLLFANLAAQEFFQSVIGSPEPGSYLALPQQKGQPFRLIPLDKDEPTDEAKLKALAAANGIADVEKFVKQYKGLVTDLKIGGAGRPFSSSVSSTAGMTQLESLGSVYDKQAAVLALGFRNIGVWKYLEKSMTGNAYAFPQSKKWATSLFSKLITGDSAVSIVPAEIRMRDPKNPNQPIVVPAIAPASLSVDTQSIATFVAFGLLTSDTDTSMIDKLRICDTNEGQCSKGTTVEAKSASGSNVYRATQTSAQDSIAFALVTDMKALSDERDKWEAIAEKSGEAQADNLLKLDAAGDLRERIETNLGKIKELAPLKKSVTEVGNQAQSAWSVMVMLTEQIAKAPTFLTFTLAQQIGGQFALAGQAVDAEIQKMGTKGICEVAPPAPPAPGNGNGPGNGLPSIQLAVDSNEFKALVSARANGNAGDMKVALANIAPPAPPEPGAMNAPKPADPSAEECMKSPEAQRRATLVELKADFAETMKLVSAVLEANANTKAAPLQINRLTNEMHSKEAFIDMIRGLTKQNSTL